VGCEPLDADDGDVVSVDVVASLSDGRGRVVTMWVTAFEKNFSSL